ncbi:MAG: serine O-acetyltransferase [Burkholderiales bacterium]
MVLTLYRIARRLHRLGIPVLPRVLYVVNRIVFSVVLPPSAVLGRNVILGYRGLGIVIHRDAVIGDNVTIGPHATIGGRSGFKRVPIIGNDVLIGVGACVLGPVKVGDGASIGANAVVLVDVPAGAVAVGVPARIVPSAARAAGTSGEVRCHAIE